MRTEGGLIVGIKILRNVREMSCGNYIVTFVRDLRCNY